MKRNITAAWAACGLFPLNPDRVLRVTPKPPAQLTVPKADEIEVSSCYQDEVPQTPVSLIYLAYLKKSFLVIIKYFKV
jgi:hypothetical protein